MKKQTKSLTFGVKGKEQDNRWYSHSQGRISNHHYNNRSTAITQLGRYLRKIMEGDFKFEGMTPREQAKLEKILTS
jgi:hypothetical protein